MKKGIKESMDDAPNYIPSTFTLKDFEDMAKELHEQQKPVNFWKDVYMPPYIRKEIDEAFDDYLKTKFN